MQPHMNLKGEIEMADEKWYMTELTYNGHVTFELEAKNERDAKREATRRAVNPKNVIRIGNDLDRDGHVMHVRFVKICNRWESEGERK